MGKQEILEEWLNVKIKEAKDNGEEMFLGVPDAWYEQALHCCNNGHINDMYLKSEIKGSVCLTCREPSHIFPTGVTDEEFKKITK